MFAGISVILPTFKRTDILLQALARVAECDPPAKEIIIHVDAGDAGTASAAASRFPGICLLNSDAPQGPGGARNKLVAASRNPFVVSLDDDSYPIDRDFFAAVLKAFEAHPGAGVLAMSIVHDDEPMVERHGGTREVADFVGCGCAYRRAAFLETSGYLPLHPAYGMEEADLALQLLDRGWRIVECGDLRVRHATDRSHQTSRHIVAAHIRNTALLAFLRYPPRLAGYGLAQVANRAVYSARRGHLLGVVQGLLQVPGTLLRHRRFRRPVAAETVARHRACRST